LAPPARPRHLPALDAVEGHVAIGFVEIGNGAQKPRLAGARRSLDGQAFRLSHLEGERRQIADLQLFDPEHSALARFYDSPAESLIKRPRFRPSACGNCRAAFTIRQRCRSRITPLREPGHISRVSRL